MRPWIALLPALAHAARYLVWANPTTSNVQYQRLSEAFDAKTPPVTAQLVLAGVSLPTCIDNSYSLQALVVCDSGQDAVLAFPLSVLDDGALAAGAAIRVAGGLGKMNAVTVSASGDVIMASAAGVWMSKLDTALRGAGLSYAAPVQLSSAGATAATVDGQYLYLALAEPGEVVRLGLATAAAAATAGGPVTSEVTAKLPGLNVALCRGGTGSLYAPSQQSALIQFRPFGSPATVSGLMQLSGGCAWDGDNTVYVSETSKGIFAVSDGPPRPRGVRQVLVEAGVQDVTVFRSTAGPITVLALAALAVVRL